MALRRYAHSATLITFFCVGLVSFVGIVYAMAWTLSSSTSETKDTNVTILGDFDGDGDLDYIAANTELVTDVYKNDLYINNGSGTFTHDSTFGHSTSGEEMVSADLDGDGDLDLVRTTVAGDIYTYRNNGAGAMTQIATWNFPYTLTDTKIGDVDMDGDIDIVVSNSSFVPQITVYLNQGNGTFGSALISSGPGIQYAHGLALADMDSDGDLDVVLYTTLGTITVNQNSGNGVFTLLSSSSIAPGWSSPLTVGDIDGDGDIDVLSTYSGFTTYFNNGLGTALTAGASYSSVEAGGAVALGDLDNDGDLDVEMPVTDSFGILAGNQTWLNDGAGVFTQTGTPTENADCTKSVSVGDIDADGDLDYVAGNQSCTLGSGRANRHYKSDQAGTSANTAPTAPTSLTASLTSTGNGSGIVLLSWGSGSDSQTATRLLQYQVRVGTGTGLHNYVSGITSSPLWVSQMMPNGQSRVRTIKALPCGHTYYWTVYSVDTGYKSTPATEVTFSLASGSCALTMGGGGGGSSSSAGGNWNFNIFRQNPTGQSQKSKISVSVFRDIDQDGVRSSYEELIKGSILTIQGITSKGKLLRRAVEMTGETAVFTITPSDEKGYTFSIDASSDVLTGLRPTTPASKTVVVKAGQSENVLFAVSPFIEKKTCLFVTAPQEGEVQGTASLTFLQRLNDIYSRPVVSRVDLSSRLVSRMDIARLLLRISCLDPATDPVQLRTDLRTAQQEGRIPGKTFDLRDASLTKLSIDASTFYTLLSQGVHIGKQTKKGLIADPKSPMTQGEFVTAVATVLPPEFLKTTTPQTEILPPHLDPLSPTVPYFRTLADLGLLPQSLISSFDPRLGLTWLQASDVLTRLAYKLGHIDLQPSSVDSTKLPTFTSLLPKGLNPGACTVRNPARAVNVTFADVPPGEKFFADLQALLPLGMKNADDKTLWTLPATGVTDYGIEHGETRLSANDPVTLAGFLRISLAYLCQPPSTRMAVITGRDKNVQGTADNLSPRDILTGLPKDASLYSRLSYTAQTKTLPFNLHMLSFDTEYLRDPVRSPLSFVSKADSAHMLASMFLVQAVRQGVISTEKASQLSEALRYAILEDLVQRKADWRTDKGGDLAEPLTNGDLVKLLAGPIRSLQPEEEVHPLPVALQWYFRIHR